METRTWLQNELARRRQKNPAYSLRAFARTLSLPPGRLSEILSGKRAVTAAVGERIANRLALPPKERKVLLGEKTKYRALPEDAFHVIADWQHFAILALMDTRRFQSKPEWIARRLGIPRLDVQTALDRLERVGLIERNKQGKITKKETALTTTHDVQSAALRHFHRQSLARAERALEDIAVEERDITSITMAIDRSKLPEAKRRIREFRRQLSEFLESGPQDEVFQLNVQLIPLTQGEDK